MDDRMIYRFRWGDRVRLRDGGPMMLVIDILSNGPVRQKLEVAYYAKGCYVETSVENVHLIPFREETT